MTALSGRGVATVNISALLPFVAGDIITFAMDIDGRAIENAQTRWGRAWIGKNGVWFGALDPTNGADLGLQAPRPEGCSMVYPSCSFGSQSTAAAKGRAITWNFGATAFTYAIPSGYVAWDALPIPAGA